LGVDQAVTESCARQIGAHKHCASRPVEKGNEFAACPKYCSGKIEAYGICQAFKRNSVCVGYMADRLRTGLDAVRTQCAKQAEESKRSD
jgi:hypothetical protein